MRKSSLCRVTVLLMALCLFPTLALGDEEQNAEAIEYYNAGVEYTRSGDFQSAVDEYLKSLALDPENVQTLYGLGYAYRQLDQLDEAIEYLSQAVGINPNYIDAYYEMGLAYWKGKQYQEAIDQFTNVTTRGQADDSKVPKAYYSLGRLYLLENKLDQAQMALQTSVGFDDQYAEAQYYLGEVYRRQKNFSSAIEAYKLAAALDSTDMQTYYKMGIVYKEDGQYEGAVEAFQKVIQSGTKFATDSRYRLGTVYNAMGRYQEAIGILEQYLELKPGTASALMALGEAHENLGQYSAAIEAYGKAAKDSRWTQYANYKIDQLQKYLEE
jgi:tetratricopeptide (TPR) repeat protein